MKCEEYFQYLWDQNDLHTLFAEQYRGDGCDTESTFEWLLKQASLDGITLVDSDIWDYDSVIYTAYKNDDEKGY